MTVYRKCHEYSGEVGEGAIRKIQAIKYIRGKYSEVHNLVLTLAVIDSLFSCMLEMASAILAWIVPITTSTLDGPSKRSATNNNESIGKKIKSD